MNKNKNCKTCRFSRMDKVNNCTPGNEGVKELRCHRYAPRMICGAGAGWANWEFPPARDWCGEWQNAEE